MNDFQIGDALLEHDKKDIQIRPRPKAQLVDAILDTDQMEAVKFPERQMFLDPWLYSQSISLISGWRGVGKSWFVISILDAVSRGQSFGNWKCADPATCLYLDGEMTFTDTKGRINQIDSNADRKAPLYVLSDAYCNFLGLPKANLLNRKWRADMTRALLEAEVKLWAVDNISSLTSGIDENSRQAWSPINDWLLHLRFQGISTILLHHTGKGGAQRGTSAREDNIDSSIILKRPFDYVVEDGAKFICTFQKSRVNFDDLHGIADTTFNLSQDDYGQLTWTHTNAKRQTKVEILKMIDDGVKQQEIAEALGVSKGYVSRIKTESINDGILSKKGELTQTGYAMVNG